MTWSVAIRTCRYTSIFIRQTEASSSRSWISKNRTNLEPDLIQSAKDYSDFLNDALHTKAQRQLGLRTNFLFQKYASMAKRRTVGWLVDPVKDELEAAGQVGVDILTSVADETASGSIIRGMNHVLISPEEAAKIHLQS